MNNFFDYIHGFVFLFVAFTLAQYNEVIGAVTTTVLLIYSIVKLYNEIQGKKNIGKDPNSKNV